MIKEVEFIFDKIERKKKTILCFPGRGQDPEILKEIMKNTFENSLNIIIVDPGEEGFYSIDIQKDYDKGFDIKNNLISIKKKIKLFLKSNNLKLNSTILFGFSMGAVFSIGLFWDLNFAGCIVYSGAILAANYISSKSESITHNNPFLLIHNRDDEIFSFEGRFIQMERFMESKNTSYESFIRDKGGHEIDIEGMNICKMFVNNLFYI